MERVGEMKVVEEVTEMKPEPISALKQMSAKASASRLASAGGPVRQVERGHSGGLVRAFPRRAAPKRSQSHRIGRPAFNKDEHPQDTRVRGVTRNNSSGLRRAAPNRNGSFRRAVPDRSSSTSSLRQYRKAQQATPLGQQIEIPYSQRGGGGDDGDSVFTTASTQTLDSIMLRKKQMHPADGQQVPATATLRRERPRLDSTASASFDFDESLHTVDSIKLHMRQVHQVLDEACDLSVFSESFASTDTYILSDYEDLEEDSDEEADTDDADNIDDDDDDDEADDDDDEGEEKVAEDEKVGKKEAE